MSIAFYILGEFSDSIRLADTIVTMISELEKNPKTIFTVDQPAEVFNNLAVFYSMKSGEHLPLAQQLFQKAEWAVRKSKHTTHRSLMTILNNLAIFYYTQKNQAESRRISEELHTMVSKNTSGKKPIYMINIAALMHKRGDLEAAEKVLNGLKTLAESEEGVQYFDLDNIKRIFLLSSLNHAKQGKLSQFEADMNSYKSLLPPIEEDVISHNKANRMLAIGLLKLGQLDRARKILENC